MRRFAITAATGCLVLLSAPAALAQEKGQVGITMGYPASVGLVWHVTDKVAIRPEFLIARSSTETTVPFLGGAESSSWNVGTGVSALFYVQRWENLRTYVSPRFSYSRATSTFDAAPTGDEGTSTNTAYSISGLFGAQYSLGRKFSVFGEVGFGFSDTTSRSELSDVRTNGQTWGTRTGLGVVFYF
jgi:hypothetical protein